MINLWTLQCRSELSRSVLLFSILLVSLLVSSSHGLQAQAGPPGKPAPEFLPGDARPDAPALAQRGPFGVGVRTVQLVHSGQIDILHATAQNPSPLYDRPVTLEVWYPAVIPHGKQELTTYSDCLSPRPGEPPPASYTFPGRALRGASPDTSKGPYPLIVVSHGYPGSRVMMSYLTENLASKGYVVAAIDHAESTHADKGPFSSTLLNRWADITFVLDQFEAANAPGNQKSLLSFLSGLTDPNRAALVGYSMGGYGVLNVAGAGYGTHVQSFVGNRLTSRLAGSPGFKSDPRVCAVVAFAPWGEAAGVWDADGLAGLKVPTLFVDGDHDDVAQYETGVKAIFDGAVNANRYMLVYENARHNVAPNPPPRLVGMDVRALLGYGEPVWDSARLNNINQHFVTAFLDTFVKGRDESAYLSVPQRPGEDDWAGFPARTALGLELWHHPAP